MNAIPPLIPSVKMALAREHDPHAAEADHAYAQKRLKILQRDRYSCVSCGFTAPPERGAMSGSLAASGYLEVHHADNNHHNNEDERNLISLCPFCHSVHHLGFAAAHRRVSLAVIPWLTQEQVNLLCNLCGVAMSRQGALAVEAEKLFQRMQGTSELLEHFFGKEDVSTLAGALSSLHRQNRTLYDQRHKALWMVRIIPELSAFKEAIGWWSAHTWLPGENWETAWWKLFQSTV